MYFLELPILEHTMFRLEDSGFDQNEMSHKNDYIRTLNVLTRMILFL